MKRNWEWRKAITRQSRLSAYRLAETAAGYLTTLLGTIDGAREDLQETNLVLLQKTAELRSFNGRIDELLVLGRAMKAEKIAEHFAVGNPYQ